MPDDSKAHSLGRADFLTDVRGQLEEAARRAEGGSLKLGGTSVEVTLKVAHPLKRSGEARAGITNSGRSEGVRTQHLKFLLTPRVEVFTTDAGGSSAVVTHGLGVHGRTAPQEHVSLPRLPGKSGSLHAGVRLKCDIRRAPA
jgi:hypothetical protein